MNELPGYYSVITANVRYDNRLTDSEKLLFAEITSLSNKFGYCTATNNYFAKLYEVTKVTISRRIAKLKEFGYLKIELIRNGNEIKQRKIYPITQLITPINTNDNTPINICDNTPIITNVKENNTSNNNTSVNNTRRIDISSGSPTPAPYKSIIQYLNSKTGKQYKHTSKNTQKLIKARINEGYTEQDFKHVINVKVEQWINDPKMSEYLRPTTLFGNKFDTYRNELLKEISDEDNPYLKYMNN